MDKNEHLTLEVTMRRNFHPYMSSTYINGFVKDQSLRNMTCKEVVAWFEKVNREFGRMALKHAGDRNLTRENSSIQGKWRSDLWNQYPKHLLEADRRVDEKFKTLLEDMQPLREEKEKLVRPHPRVKSIRSKTALPHY